MCIFGFVIPVSVPSAAVYHRLDEFEYSLINIKLAKANGYPERHWPTVDRYEQDCQKKLREGRSKSAGHEPKLGLNVESNPTIPFLAKGIRTEQVPGYGRGLVAERDFTSGDVILHEQPMLAAVQYGVEHGKCSFCTTPIMPRLVPCPDCVTAVYCSTRCLEEDKKWFHLYECGIMAKLEHISNRAFPLGPRMLFYGLGLFNGNLDQFMDFCKAYDRTGSDPITLDYTNPDRLEEFKAFHCAKEPPTKFDYDYFSKFNAALYVSIYMKQPRVASLFRSEDQQYFFLVQTLDYMRMALMLDIGHCTPYDWYTTQHFSIASLCNHACYPNTMALYHAGHLKLIVVRRIAKGEQITIPYVSPVEEFACREDHIKAVIKDAMISTCICDLCDPAKFLSLKMKLLNQNVCVKRQDFMLPIMENGDFQPEALRRFCEQHLHELPSPIEKVQIATNEFRFSTGKAFIKDVENAIRLALAE